MSRVCFAEKTELIRINVWLSSSKLLSAWLASGQSAVVQGKYSIDGVHELQT